MFSFVVFPLFICYCILGRSYGASMTDVYYRNIIARAINVTVFFLEMLFSAINLALGAKAATVIDSKQLTFFCTRSVFYERNWCTSQINILIKNHSMHFLTPCLKKHVLSQKLFHFKNGNSCTSFQFSNMPAPNKRTWVVEFSRPISTPRPQRKKHW